MLISDPKYRKGQLLINYLRSDLSVKEYLNTFLQEGNQFNGTNIVLGDKEKLFFAHNYHDACQL